MLLLFFVVFCLGQRVGQSHLEHQQLVDAVYRDAIRTDSDHPFFASCRPVDSSYISQHYHQSEHSASSISTGEDNIQKLINIIVIYTLEHGEVAYTQGMTDILSPILYVMKNEADAYIVFAAVINRIKKNFEQWCAGTLLKLQRFRHLCAVLDPELYHSLINNMEEDPFILFFGMVLIECRREFSFEDSFHLLETIWATEACITDSFSLSSDKSLAQWAGYMTLNSPEVLQQVFDESGGLYSAEPLHQTMSMSYSYSRNPSLLSYSPTQALPFLTRPSEFGPRLGEPSSNPQEQQVIVEVLSSSPPLHSPSINSSLSGSLVESLNARKELEGSGCTTSPLRRKRQQHNMDDDQLTLISQDRVDLRLRSQSDSNLHSISHSMSSQARSPMMRRSMSPQSTPIDNALVNQKLDTSSFSHSESELYDSFSNSRVVTAQHSSLTQQPFRSRSKKPTEMSDMSSVSSGTASATGLVSSFRSGEDVKNGAAFPTNASLTEKTSSAMANGNISTAEKHEETDDNGLPNGDSLRNSIPVFSPDSGVNSETLLSNGLPPSGAGVTGSEVEEGKVLPKKKVSIPSAVGSHNEPHVVSDSTSMSRQDVLSHPVNAYYSDHVGPAMDHPRKRSLKQGGRGVGVVEHGGMITAIGHSLKNSLLPNRKSADRNPRPTESLLKPGREVRSRQKTPGDQRKSRMSTSPKRIHGKSTPTDHSINPTPIQYDSDIPSSARVTPVAFFDTMEKLAKSASSSRESPIRPLVSQRRVQSDDNGRTEVGPSQRANGLVDQIQDVDAGIEETLEATSIRFDRPSELETSIMSQLVSAEDGAPRITREESLSVPFCECYSLFVCLAILVRKRDEIMQESTDFYRLSEILNSQAGMQDLNETLGIARKLYKTYRDYQADTFKWSSNSIDCWLDDTG